MAQPTQIQVTGVVASAPSSASLYSTSLQEFLGLNFTVVYGATKSGVISINSTDGNPFDIPLESITKGRIFAMRLISGATMKLMITTALGTASIPVSDAFLLHAPEPGDEYTALALVGQGDVRYFAAGDVT